MKQRIRVLKWQSWAVMPGPLNYRGQAGSADGLGAKGTRTRAIPAPGWAAHPQSLVSEWMTTVPPPQSDSLHVARA